MNSENVFESHTVTIKDRRHTEMTGIDDVLSFDDNSVIMHSALGDVTIEGEELKIDSFSSDKGVLSVSGKVDGIYYFGDTGKKRQSSKKRVFGK